MLRVKRSWKPGSALNKLSCAVVLVIATMFAAGCGKPQANRISKVVPNIPSDTSFGPLYPRINAYLSASPPDVISAARDTRQWAESHLEGFIEGSCASTQIVYDAEFTRIFGRSTLGVTLPWMQIYLRDGIREEDAFLWKDASLFVSTLLHEYVHAMQRARQTHAFLGTDRSCDAASSALNSRRSVFTAGFEALRFSPILSGSVPGAERTLLYRWSSPIERARDEVEAALLTVKWMSDHENELNALTTGGANNWAYGVQYMQQLKLLAKSNCFSPDDETFADERRIYEVEVPQFLAELRNHEPSMQAFLQSHRTTPVRVALSDLDVTATPTGRMGARCNPNGFGDALKAPLPSSNDIHLLDATEE